MINTKSFLSDIEEQVNFILNLKKRYSDVDVLIIFLRYHQYLNSHLSAAEKDIDFAYLKRRLNNLYKSKRQLIYNSQYSNCKRVCSFCGRDAGDTLDHYFPKSKYPEFSLLLHNLIPCCSDCNTLKHNKVIGEDIFLAHPFFVCDSKKILYKLALKRVLVVNGVFCPELELLVDDSDIKFTDLFMVYESLDILKVRDKIIRRSIDYLRNHLKDKAGLNNLIQQHGNIKKVSTYFFIKSRERLETLTVLDYLVLDLLSDSKNLQMFFKAV